MSNPHDHFFRETFSRREVAVDFVRHYLPPEVVAQLDLAALHVVKDSFVDPELREHFADLLYRTRLQDGQDAYVYVLFEHKSHPEPLVAFQLLRYLVRIWEQVLKQNELTHLPPIVPVIVYHGAEAWRIAVHFRGLFVDRPALAEFIPDFRYQLCDLSDYSDEEIAGKALLRVALLILKHIFDGELRTRLPDILSLMDELAQARSGLEYLEIVLRYVTAAAPGLSTADLKEAVEEAFPQVGGALMATIAQTWVEQGIAQGFAQGIEQGVKQGVERGVRRGVLQEAREAVFDILEARFTTVSPIVVTIIATIDDPLRLKRLRKRALTVASLAEFEQLLKV
ncbi:MAG: Rpn family recombination-promoting nuclease/putative transposase [Anaerolineae bacterium]|nr:Rpn family recombination-promoting nuclease/putative transposase [Anaerolineae bacterium]